MARVILLTMSGPDAGKLARLDILKALGDNTRYAIYLELARSPVPLATAEIADTLGLHVNTVRPHLERMRDVGLLGVFTEPKGVVGRPQHRYALAPEAPSLGLEPPSFPVLARMLLRVAAQAGLAGEDAAEAGREEGRADAGRTRTDGDPATGRGSGSAAAGCMKALTAELERLGFDPAVAADDDGERATIAFTHCPFRELAESNPELICSLHRGLVEGFLDELGAGAVEVAEFRSLVHRDNPCQVELVGRLGDVAG